VSPPLQSVGDRFLPMNQIPDDAPRGQKHVKNGDQYHYAGRIAYRKQRRVNPDVVRSIYERDSGNVERSSTWASYVIIITLGEQPFYSDRYRGDTKQSKPFMQQNLSTKKTDQTYDYQCSKA